jgi:hypothetical protein
MFISKRDTTFAKLNNLLAAGMGGRKNGLTKGKVQAVKDIDRTNK